MFISSLASFPLCPFLAFWIWQLHAWCPSLAAVPWSLYGCNRWSSLMDNEINILVSSQSQIHLWVNEMISLVAWWWGLFLWINKTSFCVFMWPSVHLFCLSPVHCGLLKDKRIFTHLWSPVLSTHSTAQ